jgi:uncharacterized protein YjgD (DUF1641 family)
MARPISFEQSLLDPKAQLRERLERAPGEHAEALLASYELLQDLRDAHVFELLHGVLKKGDQAMELAVNAVKEPGALRDLTNLIILGKILGSIDPALLHGVADAVRETVETTHHQEAEPPGFFALLQQLRHKETRRALGLMTRFLGALGRHLPVVGRETSGPAAR